MLFQAWENRKGKKGQMKDEGGGKIDEGKGLGWTRSRKECDGGEDVVVNMKEIVVYV